MTVTYPELRTGTVAELMTPGVLTCLPPNLLVVSDAGLPIGGISSLDVARALAAEPGPEEN